MSRERIEQHARALMRDLDAQGLPPVHVLELATELLAQVIAARRADAEGRSRT